MNNKTRFQEWLIIVALILWVGMTIITCSGLWNAAAQVKVATQVKVAPFYIVVSIVLAVATCAAAFFIGKKVWNYYGELSIKESQKK